MQAPVPGQPAVLSDRVHRITAPNPGMMTGPGTNTYLVGRDDIAVIDPGPLIESHIEAILALVASLGGTLRWILCTHTHRDHSPAAQVLAQRTGARVIGMLPPPGPAQDDSFRPDERWQDDSTLATDEFILTAIHTPGHASNHLCYLLENEGMLFSGDHIMQGSTVVISPPDGDMREYLTSLQCLAQFPLRQIAPGHGAVMDDPASVIESLIRHRLMREAKVVNALRDSGPVSLGELVLRVYDDVPAFLHPVAQHSLHAHLLKLVGDGRASLSGAHWSIQPGDPS